MSRKEYITIKGKVMDVIGRTIDDYGSSSGVIMSGKGQMSALEIKIKSKSPVKTISLRGCWPIEKNDYIRVMIDMEKRSGHSYHREICHREELKENEQATQIEKIRNNEVVATYVNGY